MLDECSRQAVGSDARGLGKMGEGQHMHREDTFARELTPAVRRTIVMNNALLPALSAGFCWLLYLFAAVFDVVCL